MIRTLLLPLLLSLAYPAHSLEPHTCQDGAFPSFDGEISSAVITAESGSRVHFRDDAEGCPDAETCIQHAYLINGDRVLLSHRESRWACAWYFGKKRRFVGWLPQSNLKLLADRTPPKPSDWAGTWSPISGENVIHIAIDDSNGNLRIEGSATWRSSTTISDDQIVHEGSFEGIAKPISSHLMVAEYDCVVRMQLVSDSLVVTDNSNCGGMYVRFDDVYRRRP